MLAPGSRAARPLTVEVTDETGRPVAGAAVSFHLPEDGAGAVFAHAMHTDVSTTDAQGRASMRPVQVGRLPGTFQIRVVAVKEQARAGALAAQYVAEAAHGGARAASHARGRWIALAAAVVGGTAAGVLSASRTAPAAASATPPAAPATAPVTIGTPSTTVGRP